MTSNSRSVADTTRDAYLHWTTVTLRYGDTDRQGHVNNAVFCTFYESGRTAFLFDGEACIAGANKNFVIAKLTLDFLKEINFPGQVEIGSRIVSNGSSSLTVHQAIFKDGECCSTSQSVIVQIDDATKRSTPLEQLVLEKLARWR